MDRFTIKLLFLALLAMAAYLYIPTLWDKDCFKKRTENIKVDWSCMIFSSAVYNRLDHFCDCHEDWVETSKIIINSEQSRLRDSSFFSQIYWGSKRMPCGNNTFNVLSDIDDSKVFFYLHQDTTKSIYDGALTKLEFGSDIMYTPKRKMNDVGAENRNITRNTSRVQVNYLLDYQEVDVKVLREFRRSIKFDSTYFQRNKIAEYRLIDKEHKKCLASIRYEDFGKRFYFEVY